jgi:hypothetical protein
MTGVRRSLQHMNCSNCGKPLPPGVAFCPFCNAATPYNTTGQNFASPYDPTIAAGSYGNPPSAPGSNQASPYGSSPNNYASQNPYTAYGVPQGAQQPSPYGGNTPSYDQNAQQSFGSSPNLYAPPPLPQSGQAPYGYGAPPTPGYAPGMQPGGFGTATPPKRRSKVGLIVGISLLAVVLLCGGLIALVTSISRNAVSAVNTTATSVAATTTAGSNTPASTSAVSTPASTPVSGGGIPAASDVVPSASKIIYNPELSSAIDANYNPTKVATTFKTGQSFYLTFDEDSQGKDGYIQVKWYLNGALDDTRILTHSAKNDHGYFEHALYTAGPAEATLSWCTQANCSDAQLAQVLPFTVSDTAAVPSSTTTYAAVIADNRRNG